MGPSVEEELFDYGSGGRQTWAEGLGMGWGVKERG